MSLAFAMKGVRGGVRRAANLPVRYGASSIRLHRRLEKMISLCDKWEITPTIAVTAALLERHPEIASVLTRVDVAIHGYRHVAYADLSFEEQAADLEAALRAFGKHGLTARGFRAPYLRPDRLTMELVRSRKFLFDSSVPEIVFPREDSLGRSVHALAESRYGLAIRGGRSVSVLPGFIELPVSLPDDEILVDGLRLRRPSDQWNVFERMLTAARTRSSILVLQIHPERYEICEDALRLVLQHAIDEGAWRASLSEAAEWILREGWPCHRWPNGSSYAIAITGDLDAMSLLDFAHRFVGE